MKTRYGFSIRFDGEVDSIRDNDAPTETIDDIRGVVLESFKKDLQAGVSLISDSVSIFNLSPQIEND
jgi:hypothetical protein